MRFLAAAAAFMALSGSIVDVALAEGLDAKLRAEIEAAERAIVNVQITGFSIKCSERSGLDGDFVQRPDQFEGNLWMDGQRRGCLRVELTAARRRSKSGEIIITKTDTGYDGQKTVVVDSFYAVEGQQGVNPRTVTINGEYPRHFKEASVRVVAGQHSVLGYLASRKGEPYFSGLFAEYEKAHRLGELQVSEDTVNGLKCVRLVVPRGYDQTLKGEYWFAPSKNYGLVKMLESGAEVPGQSGFVIGFREMYANDLVTAGEHASFPSKVTVTISTSKPGPLFQKFDFVADKVVLNDTSFVRSVFIPPVPPQYVVQDNTTNHTYISGGDTENLRTAIVADANVETSSIATPPATPVADSSSASMNQTAESGTAKALLVAGTVVTVGALLYVLRRAILRSF